MTEYTNFIWAMANRIAGSAEEAEAAAFEIFSDIWRYRGTVNPEIDEHKVVGQIAYRRLRNAIEHTNSTTGN